MTTRVDGHQPIGRVLVVGDANVDLVLTGDVVPRFGQAEQLLDGARLALGSSAGIAASGIAKLGVATGIVASVGTDDFGRFTLDELESAGVTTDYVSRCSDKPTGVSVILSTPDDRAILTHAGALASVSASAVTAAVQDFAPHHVHFASYFLLKKLAAELPELLVWIRTRNATTSLDTNWDPAGEWRGLDGVLPLLDFVFPNLEELREIASALHCDRDDDQSRARFLAGLGPTVVVKSGADGGWLVEPDGHTEQTVGIAVEVVDTTGAGDSFDAGFLAAIAYGHSDSLTRLRWAVAAGSLSTRAAGGTTAQPSFAELMKVLTP